MDKYKSKLIFSNYIVKRIDFAYNEKYNGENVNIKLHIDKKVQYIDKQMIVTLIVKLFDDDNEIYPFKMTVEIKGLFKIEDNSEGINFEPNAIAILYPYVRAIVSTYTANANVTPLILPPINVNKLIEETNKDKKD